MKKTMLFLAGALFLGVTASFAQVDSTDSKMQDRTQTTPSTTQPQTGNEQDQNSSYTKDMVKVQQGDVPANLRTTLKGSQYKGWESGTVYRSKNSDGYLIEVKDGDQTKVHRFDAKGKAMPDQN